MKIFAVFLTLTGVACVSWANDFVCEKVETVEKKASSLKIEYDQNKAVAVFLRSPGSEQWRPMDLLVQPIVGGAEDDLELISVKPFEIENLDWSKQSECFVEIGTQWFFTFNRESENHTVQFVPYFQTESQSCIPPKFQPQTHKLDCQWL